MSTSTSAPASPLEIHPLAMGLLYGFDPKTPREIILARQAAWAASLILNMIGDSPAQPDASWLRLHNTADRILHRNLRLLDRLTSRRPQPVPVPAPTQRPEPAPAPAPSPVSSSPAPSPVEPSRPTPPSSRHRRDAFRRPRPNLDLACPPSSSPVLPVSATPALSPTTG